MSLHDSIFAAVAGTESADLENTIAVTAEEAAEAVVDKELAEVEVDIVEAEKDIDELEAKTEILEEKVEELEEEIAGLEAMVSGATPFNAGLAQDMYRRAAKIANRFSAPDAQIGVMGAESFADSSTAALNIHAGMLSFKDKVKSAGSAIKKFFVDLYNSFIAFFQGIFNKFKGLENKANAMKKSTSSKEAKTGEISLPAAASWLAADGGAPDVVGAMNKVIAGVDTAAKAADGKNAVGGIESAANGLKGLGQAASTASSEGSETFKVSVGKGTFTVTVPKTEEGLAKVGVSALAGGEADKSVAVSKSRLGTILTEVATKAKALQFAKLDSKALQAQRDKTIATLERMASEDKADVKKDIAGIKAAVKAGLKLQQGGLKVAGSILGAQLAFVGAHF